MHLWNSAEWKSKKQREIYNIYVKLKRLTHKRKAKHFAKVRTKRSIRTNRINMAAWWGRVMGVRNKGIKEDFKKFWYLSFFGLIHLLAASLKIPFFVISSGSLPKGLSAHLSVSLQISPLWVMSDQHKLTFTNICVYPEWVLTTLQQPIQSPTGWARVASQRTWGGPCPIIHGVWHPEAAQSMSF